jgi:DUF4097 and DUF4098 domain-containing protein YvlB
MNRRHLALSAALLAAFVACTPVARGAKHDRGLEPLTCDHDWGGDGRSTHCDIRETTLKDFAGSIDVDPGQNGGASVHGWDRPDALVRARVRASADTDAAAADLAGRIRVDTTGGRIRTDGPESRDEQQWSVDLQVFVPRASQVTVRTMNGGIALGDLTGEVRFEALNGGVSLSGLAGNVSGHTTNGGLAVELTGDHWTGEALDVYTVNGGVNLQIPRDYSARLETGTEHGGFNLDYPVTIQGKIDKRLSVTLGSGGPLVRVMTTNGGIRVRQSE